MDGVKFKKPVDLSAPDYVEHLMEWIEGQLEDPSIFPPTTDQPFRKDFQKIVANIFKRMFRYTLPSLFLSPLSHLSSLFSPLLSSVLCPLLSPLLSVVCLE